MNSRALMAAFILVVSLLLVHDVRAEEEGGAKVGPGKAVIAANAKEGMRLSEAAIKRLGVDFQPAKSGETLDLPLASLVTTRDETSVYRLRDGWIKRVEVQLRSKSASSAKVRVESMKPGDRIVVTGAPFLRLAELDVLGSEKEEGDER